MEINVGDTLILKKEHPCGSNSWQVTRVGADFKIKCFGCGHEVMSSRANIEKSVKKITSGAKSD